ncbi:cyclopropane mycolic acid synthase 1 isoform X2 [Manihot esculenta]|nr:cyclopropane mycolic acid synthase 1 isoform X2 [Manihot esculenta]
MADPESFDSVRNQIHKAPSMFETLGRRVVTRFLGSFISTGCLILQEADGTDLTFEGSGIKCSLKVHLKIHNPQFYWKVMTRADVGLAEAYIDGDFSFADADEGLLNLIMLLIANNSASKSNKKRGWWTPLLFTATFASAKLVYQHVLRQNTLTQARRNISRHYDLSNDMFALFMGETMSYSCGIFKTEDEDLQTAQLRKFSILIEKARIEPKQEVLDIGCGWGIFAIEVVKRTGCKYTGITLSEEQLKFAEKKVKEVGYRTISGFNFATIVNCLKVDLQLEWRVFSEMIEHVGHEYMEEFFGCCDKLLSEDGLFVLQQITEDSRKTDILKLVASPQFSSMPDEYYEEDRWTAGFIREYIFPGGCLPSFSRVISAMNAASRLCVEHVENIGSHYYHTLRRWRENFLDNQNKILAMGFDEKFIKKWEYYFDYCAAGFRTYTLGNYQVVFSRTANIEILQYPYKGFPSAYVHLSTT